MWTICESRSCTKPCPGVLGGRRVADAGVVGGSCRDDEPDGRAVEKGGDLPGVATTRQGEVERQVVLREGVDALLGHNVEGVTVQAARRDVREQRPELDIGPGNEVETLAGDPGAQLCDCGRSHTLGGVGEPARVRGTFAPLDRFDRGSVLRPRGIHVNVELQRRALTEAHESLTDQGRRDVLGRVFSFLLHEKAVQSGRDVCSRASPPQRPTDWSAGTFREPRPFKPVVPSRQFLPETRLVHPRDRFDRRPFLEQSTVVALGGADGQRAGSLSHCLQDCGHRDCSPRDYRLKSRTTGQLVKFRVPMEANLYARAPTDHLRGRPHLTDQTSRVSTSSFRPRPRYRSGWPPASRSPTGRRERLGPDTYRSRDYWASDEERLGHTEPWPANAPIRSSRARSSTKRSTSTTRSGSRSPTSSDDRTHTRSWSWKTLSSTSPGSKASTRRPLTRASSSPSLSSNSPCVFQGGPPQGLRQGPDQRHSSAASAATQGGHRDRLQRRRRRWELAALLRDGLI